MKNIIVKGVVVVAALLNSSYAKKGQTTSCLLGLSYAMKSFKTADKSDASKFLQDELKSESSFAEVDVDAWTKAFSDLKGSVSSNGFGIYSGFNYKLWAGLQIGLNVGLEYTLGKEVDHSEKLDPITKKVKKVVEAGGFFEKHQTLLDAEKDLIKKQELTETFNKEYVGIHNSKEVYPDLMPTLIVRPGFDLGYEFEAGPVSITPLVGIKCDVQFSKDPFHGWDRNKDKFFNPFFSTGVRVSCWGIFAETTFGWPLRKETGAFDQLKREQSYQWNLILGAEF